jgi:hypothetical protein
MWSNAIDERGSVAVLRSGYAVWPSSIDAAASNLTVGGRFDIGRYALAPKLDELPWRS